MVGSKAREYLCHRFEARALGADKNRYLLDIHRIMETNILFGFKDEIITMTDLGKLLQEKREEILALAAKHGAYNVRVFGSAVRGEAGPVSDVDFLVSVGPKRSPFSPAVCWQI